MADERDYTVKADFPNLARGQEVQVPGVGYMDNGSSKKVQMTREEAEYLSSAFGITVTTEGGKKVTGEPVTGEDTTITEKVEDITAKGGET